MEIWLDCRSSGDKNDKNQTTKLKVSKARLNESNVILVPSNCESIPSSSSSSLKEILMIDDESKNLVRTKQGHSKKVDDGKVCGIVVDIVDSAGQDKALAAIGSVEWVLAVITNKKDWKMIPAENIIAAAKSAGTKIAMSVERVEDVVGLSRALELGVDALCVSANATDELWSAVMEAQKERNSSPSQLDDDKVVDLPPAIIPGYAFPLSATLQGNAAKRTILADRVCIDFVQALKPTEGCWIGSSAKLMTLVLVEKAAVTSNSFVSASTSFRVNGGPVHSYVLLGDGVTTKYLCELQPGDEVLLYDCKTGTSRSIAVGRLQIDPKPCVILGLQAFPTNNTTTNKDIMESSQIFLEQEESVRIGNGEGKSVKVSEFTSSSKDDRVRGKKVLLRISKTGTHIGIAYTGKVKEI